jgi:hypothetical protein
VLAPMIATLCPRCADDRIEQDPAAVGDTEQAAPMGLPFDTTAWQAKPDLMQPEVFVPAVFAPVAIVPDCAAQPRPSLETAREDGHGFKSLEWDPWMDQEGMGQKFPRKRDAGGR